MDAKKSSSFERPIAQNCFATTHWSVVLTAGGDHSEAAAEALAQLCRAYWFPLFSYIRRRGFELHDAQDLTQEFFARLLAKRDLGRAEPEKGRFRSFLLASLKHFLLNEWDRVRAAKRGGGCTFLSWDDPARRTGGRPVRARPTRGSKSH